MQFTEQRFHNALLFKVSGRIDRDTADHDGAQDQGEAAWPGKA